MMSDKEKEERLNNTILILKDVLEKSNKKDSEEYERIQKLLKKRKLK